MRFVSSVNVDMFYFCLGVLFLSYKYCSRDLHRNLHNKQAMDKQESMIAEFCAIADTTEERARFYLESSAWQLPVALSSFFDTGSAIPAEQENEEAMEEGYEPPVDKDPDFADEERQQPSHGRATRSSTSKTDGKQINTRSRATRSSKFSSIRDLKEDEGDDSSEEEGQRYYAGGSEHSGELIVGPPRKKESNEEITKKLFAEAKKHGAETVDPEERSKSANNKPKYFSGGGYRLGDTEGDSQFVGGAEAPAQSGQINVVLKFWSNGFTVGDGPLRDFDDPSNKEFLNSIKKGEIPAELVQMARGGEVHVDMEDHRQEEYKAPKKVIKPFSGQGHMLGSPAPTVTHDAPVTKQTSSVDPVVRVDKSKETTTIQIRLSDGTRLRQQFNHTHRISDIRSFIGGSNPDYGSRSFVLMTTFPNKELTDEMLTLQEAKLLNSVVVQKLT